MENENDKWYKQEYKHVGRPKRFEHPEEMWNEAQDYFEEQSKRKWIRHDYKGKDAVHVHLPTSAPFTIEGFCHFLGVSTVYWRTFKSNLNKNEVKTVTEEVRTEFLSVIARIEEIIFRQQYEGAAVGAYNGNLVARKLGLVDKQDVTSDGDRLTIKIEADTDEKKNAIDQIGED